MHVTGLVHAVHVTEGQRRNVAALLAQTQSLNGLHRVINSGVQGVVNSAFNAVFLAADGTNFNLKHNLCLVGALQKLSRNFEVLVKINSGTIPHMGVKDGVFAAGHSLFRLGEQGKNKTIQLVLGAVVSVQCDVHVVLFGDLTSVCRECQGTSDHIFLRCSRPVRCATSGCLNNTVRTSLSETAKSGVEGLRGGDVYCRVGEAFCFRILQHLCVDFGGCNSHADSLTRVRENLNSRGFVGVSERHLQRLFYQGG